MQPLQERIAACLVRHPDWDDKRVCNSIVGSRIADVKAVRSGVPLPLAPPPLAPAVAQPPPDAVPSGDFSLAGIFLLSRKPLDVMKGRLHSLRQGVGYKLETLCRAWGCSEDNVREHAKKHGALRYVEASPGEYVAVVVHPETKQGV